MGCCASRFEQLALEYNSDDIGDDAHEDPSDRGIATTDQYAKVMDDFLTSHATQDHAYEGGQEYLPPSAACAKGVTGEEATVAAEALAKVRANPRLPSLQFCLQYWLEQL